MTHLNLPPNHESKISHPDLYDALVLARRDFLQIWHQWAASRPPAAHVSAELEATVGAVWGIAATLSAAPAEVGTFENLVTAGIGGVYV